MKYEKLCYTIKEKWHPLDHKNIVWKVYAFLYSKIILVTSKDYHFGFQKTLILQFMVFF